MVAWVDQAVIGSLAVIGYLMYVTRNWIKATINIPRFVAVLHGQM